MSNIGAVRRDFLKWSGVGALGTALGTASAYGDHMQAFFGVPIYDVRAFGATGGGNIPDTDAVNKAIEAAAGAGGGTVLFPSGSYLCYSIRLKSNVSLYLGPGATILAADPATGGGGYDPPEPNQWDKYQDFGHSHWHNSLIWGEELSNVSICGPGRIWGRGLSRGEG